MCVTLTPKAVQFMQRMVRFGSAGAAAGFRLTVKPGGCSGFDSNFTIEAQAQPNDTVVEDQGVRLFLEQSSCELLRGYTIDFNDTRLDSALVFTNPAAPHVCGCSSGSGAGPRTGQVSFMPKPASLCTKG